VVRLNVQRVVKLFDGLIWPPAPPTPAQPPMNVAPIRVIRECVNHVLEERYAVPPDAGLNDAPSREAGAHQEQAGHARNKLLVIPNAAQSQAASGTDQTTATSIEYRSAG